MKNLVKSLSFVVLLTSTAVLAQSDAASLDEKLVSLERRWNTALLRTYSAKDTFKWSDGTASSVVDFFRWDRCQDGGVSAGAHPTYRGGTTEAYSVAERILASVNSDRVGDEPAISLADLRVMCPTSF